jgi:hypothetical protein
MADNEVSPPVDQPNSVENETQAPLEPIRAPQVDEEEDISEDSQEESPVHVVSRIVPQTRSNQEVALVYLQRVGLHTLLFLQVVWNLLSRAANVTQTISSGVVRSLQTRLYFFFQGSTYPYRVHEYVLSGPGIAPVEWYYNADSKVFVSATLHNTSNDYQTHHFQWLSGEVQFNGLTLYDITEFLEQLKWAGSTRPSTAHVLSAWALYSGIVLQLREGLVLKTINEDGSESSLPLCG